MLAVVFLVTSLAYNILTSTKTMSTSSVLMDATEEAVQAPAAPEPEDLGVEIEETAPADQAAGETAPAPAEQPAQQ